MARTESLKPLGVLNETLIAVRPLRLRVRRVRFAQIEGLRQLAVVSVPRRMLFDPVWNLHFRL